MTLALVGCAGNPWPAIAPGPNGTGRTILLLGDSLLGQTAPYLRDALAFYGMPATVIDESYPGTGLLDDNAVAVQTQKVSAHPAASIVVVAFSGNCFLCLVERGSPQFYDQWMTNLVAILDHIRGLGKQVVLVLPPPVRPDLLHAQIAGELRERYLGLAPGGAIVATDWWPALADVFGGYQQVLYYADLFVEPAWHVVRSDDGVHLTPDGARRTATWTAAALRSFYG